jgi:hypothetical protein
MSLFMSLCRHYGLVEISGTGLIRFLDVAFMGHFTRNCQLRVSGRAVPKPSHVPEPNRPCSVSHSPDRRYSAPSINNNRAGTRRQKVMFSGQSILENTQFVSHLPPIFSIMSLYKKERKCFSARRKRVKTRHPAFRGR